MLATLLVLPTAVGQDTLHAAIAGGGIQADVLLGLEVGAQVVEEGLVVAQADQHLALVLIAAVDAARFAVLDRVALDVVDIQRRDHLDA